MGHPPPRKREASALMKAEEKDEQPADDRKVIKRLKVIMGHKENCLSQREQLQRPCSTEQGSGGMSKVPFSSFAPDGPLITLQGNDNLSHSPRESSEVPESISNTSKAERELKLSMLEFEARSAKDGAWYDVESFLTHRVRRSGEPEVLVRFVGFGAEEDEWVNVKHDVRVQSLPIEAHECDKIAVGDLVLCFRERKEQASHYDAHVLGIQRRLHDIRGCRCIFLVKYVHDLGEERVPLRRICRRPTSMSDLTRWSTS